MAVASARVKRTRCRTARGRAGSRSNAARFAVARPGRAGDHAQRVVQRPELVDLVQVLRLPERVTNQSRAAIER